MQLDTAAQAERCGEADPILLRVPPDWMPRIPLIARVRFNYKIVPLSPPHPAFRHETSTWVPLLPVRLSYKHSRQTPRFEALVDSGQPIPCSEPTSQTLWESTSKRIKSSSGGIVPGPRIDVYFHDVNLWVGADMIRMTAGFSRQMSFAAVLGRRGVFEHFIVTFDRRHACWFRYSAARSRIDA